MKHIVEIAGKEWEVEVGSQEARVEGLHLKAELIKQPGSKLHTLFIENKAIELLMDGRSGQYLIQLLGHDYTVTVKRAVVKELERYVKKDEREQMGSIAGQAVVANMPGLVAKVGVKEGQEVKAGDGLIIINAMKMENEIRAPCAGVIEKVNVREGQEVEKGQLLCYIRSI